MAQSLPRAYTTVANYNVQTFVCKKCRKCFRKDTQEFEDRWAFEKRVWFPHWLNPAGSDEYCPHCDNHFVLDAKTPTPAFRFEGEDARVDARMLKDDRMQGEQHRSIFDVKDAPDKLG